MTRSPYDILGVSENASMDEVKKAYRKKARENHPDLNPNDPSAADRMNEINEAYDRITNPDKYAKERARAKAGGQSSAGASGSGAGYAGGQAGYGTGRPGYGGDPFGGDRQTQGPGGTYVWVNGFGFDMDDLFGGGAAAGPIHPEASATDSAEVRTAISFINADRFRDAAQILNKIPSTGRNARWHYLSAIANWGAGNTVLAYDQIRRAVQMEPGNPDYARAQRSFSAKARTYEQQSQEQGFSMGAINPMSICCGCMAIQWLPWACMGCL